MRRIPESEEHDPQSETVQSNGRCKLGEFVRQLEYKGEWSGRSVVVIDQYFPSSKRCSGCGYTIPKMVFNVRSWFCPECRANHDRDVNVAKNIKWSG